MPPEVAQFDHFAPAHWLLDSPQILDNDSPAVLSTLHKAEKFFATFNALLS
jgi:hypothetical protein